MISIDIPASTKFVIRQQILTSLAKPVNIFSSMPVKNQLSLIHDRIKDYFVVGDVDFKRKYCTQKNSTIMNQTFGKLTNLTQTNINTLYQEKTKVQQNYRIKTQGNSLHYADDRQKRALMRFEWNKEKQQKMRNYFNMKRRATDRSSQQVNKTISYKRKQIQIIPNPQLVNLINDNIPQYWKNSLRDNEKRLKQHIRGNHYKKQIQQQMLQTMKGRQKLINSIPSIKKQILSLAKNSNQNSLTSTFTILGRRSKVSISSTQSIDILENKQVPKLVCEQVYKIQYNPSYKY